MNCGAVKQLKVPCFFFQDSWTKNPPLKRGVAIANFRALDWRASQNESLPQRRWRSNDIMKLKLRLSRGLRPRGIYIYIIFLRNSTNIPNHVKSKLLIKSCSNYITFCPSPMHWLVLNRIIPTGFMPDKWYYKRVTPYRTMECDLLQPTRVFMKVGCVWGSVCIDISMYMVKKWMASHFPSFGGSIRP